LAQARANRNQKNNYEQSLQPRGLFQKVASDTFFGAIVHPIEALLATNGVQPVQPPSHLLRDAPVAGPLAPYFGAGPAEHGQVTIAQTSGEADNPGPRRNRKGKGKGGKKKGGTTQTRKQTPFAYSTTVRGSDPRIMSGNGWVRIRHSELLDTIGATGTSNFAANLYQYPINPGLYETFPWLSTEAMGYERHKFMSLSFEYVGRCPTTSQGAVLMAFDYDADDKPPGSEKLMATYHKPVEATVYDCAGIEADTKLMYGDMNVKYNRYGAFTPGGSTTIREFDCGNFYINIVDTTSSSLSNFGKLWVHYDVVLSIPRALSPVTQSWLTSLRVTGSSTGSSVALPFGTAPTIFGGNFYSYNTSNGTFTILRPGRYTVTLRFLGTNLFTIFEPTTFVFTDGDGTVVTPNTVFGVSNAVSNAGTEAITIQNSFTFNQPYGTMSFPLTGFASTISGQNSNIFLSPFSTSYDQFS